MRDDDVGLAPELLPRLFDLFSQAEDGARGGLGIGLHLVRSLARLHGGTVTASSAGLGRGREFVVYLPLAPELCSADGKAKGARPLAISPCP